MLHYVIVTIHTSLLIPDPLTFLCERQLAKIMKLMDHNQLLRFDPHSYNRTDNFKHMSLVPEIQGITEWHVQYLL